MNLPHISWFQENQVKISTSDGKTVKIIDFNHQQDKDLLMVWAKHFREHYIADEDIDGACAPIGMNRSDYLKEIKFPSKGHIKSGDFSEILVADYLQFVLNYSVPRTRYSNKINRDSSPMGVDIIGFKLTGRERDPNDELLTCEVKASLASKIPGAFQEAIDDSKKDIDTRLPEALNAMRQRLKEQGKIDQMKTVERFQNITARPHKRITGAALVCSKNYWSDEHITSSVADHPNPHIHLLAIKGESMMLLASHLYELAYASA